MRNWLANRRRIRRAANELYESIVAHARRPIFYTCYGVPDTVSGRFELIVLHLFIVLERLRNPEDGQAVLGQRLVETFVTTMDHELREMGVSDVSVPKTMQRAARGCYGRLQSYSEAARSNDIQLLPAAIQRNVFEGKVKYGEPAAYLSDYVRLALVSVHAQSIEQVIALELGFPDPASAFRGARYE